MFTAHNLPLAQFAGLNVSNCDWITPNGGWQARLLPQKRPRQHVKPTPAPWVVFIGGVNDA